MNDKSLLEYLIYPSLKNINKTLKEKLNPCLRREKNRTIDLCGWWRTGIASLIGSCDTALERADRPRCTLGRPASADYATGSDFMLIGSLWFSHFPCLLSLLQNTFIYISLHATNFLLWIFFFQLFPVSSITHRATHALPSPGKQ